MKKILLSLLAVFAAVSTNAQTEVELTLTEGHTLLVSTIEEAGGTDADIVRFYIKNNSGASREGWGIGGFAESDNWSPSVAWTGMAGEEWAQEHTVAEIKSVAKAGQYHGVGITINIYNDCKVEKCTLVLQGDAPAITTTTIWEGSCSFGDWSENGVSIPAEKFANAVEGDVLEFIYTTDDSNPNTWWQFKTVFAGTEDCLTSNANVLNDWGCATVAKGSTSFKITLNAADIAILKEKGLFANGYYNIVTAVNLNHKESADVIKATATSTVKAGKFVENGNIVIVKNGKKFNVAGVPVK